MSIARCFTFSDPDLRLRAAAAAAGVFPAAAAAGFRRPGAADLRRSGLFILPQPAIRADAGLCPRRRSMCAPPPNNIIFNNIHNTTVINNVINQPPQPGPGAAGAASQPGATRGAPGAAVDDADRGGSRLCRLRLRSGLH